MYYYQRLKDLREDMDLTQEDIAKILNTHKNYYSKYETGKIPIPFERIIKLAKFYNVSIDYIAGLTNDKGGFHKTSGEISNYFELSEENKKTIRKNIDFLLEEQFKKKEKKLRFTFQKAN